MTDKCSEGTLLLPFLDESEWIEELRIFIYLVALLWCFMGVAIIADVFMCAIETITSKTKQVKVARQDSDQVDLVEIRIWNDTVANLTLMALGSSAPEILLAIIEITILNKFNAGELGPSTIVGSAAFNLLVITGVCIMTIPAHEQRRIKAVKVFAVTASFSVLAYVWLFFALTVSSKNEIELWEAILTFLLFPVLVVIAYIADKDYCSGKISPQDPGVLELAEGSKVLKTPAHDPEVESFIKEVSRNPNLTEDEAAVLVAAHIKSKQPKNYGYYRVGAIRDLGGSHKLTPNMDPQLRLIYEELSEVGFSSSGASAIMNNALGGKVPPARVEFAAPKCAVLESDKLVRIGVRRTGNTKITASVNYETINGTAMAGSDYEARKDVLVFKPGETAKHIDITIIDDDEWEENEVFFIKLSRFDYKDDSVEIGGQSVTEVTIINDDEPGIFSLENPSFMIKESIGKASFKVERTQGTDGKVEVKWKTIDQTAVNGKDYHGGSGTLVFEHGEQVKYISIDIIDDKDFEKDETFIVELTETSEGAFLGNIKSAAVTIVNDDEYRRLFDRVVSLTHLNLRRLELGSETWGAQFREAMSVNGGDVVNATTQDYVMHFFTFAWKVIFAVCPPCTWFGGWLTFCVALGMIGLLTVIVGDLATIFGCLIGLKAEVTAITFVALGTSLPDLFASKCAAISEKHADAAVGNVTGSNSVNVFLGLGTPWLIACIYHTVKGTKFIVEAGTLSISVITYSICAIVCIVLLVVRRKSKFMGRAELGGPSGPKYFSGSFLIFLWLLYVLISSLVSYKIITF